MRQWVKRFTTEKERRRQMMTENDKQDKESVRLVNYGLINYHTMNGILIRKLIKNIIQSSMLSHLFSIFSLYFPNLRKSISQLTRLSSIRLYWCLSYSPMEYTTLRYMFLRAYIERGRGEEVGWLLRFRHGIGLASWSVAPGLLRT